MRAVVFDMDGVIFDTEQRLLECWQVVMHGINGMEAEEVARMYPQVIGMNDNNAKAKLLELCGEDFPVDFFIDKTLAMLQERNHKEGMPLKPGIRELILWLKNEGYLIGLATSTKEDLAVEELESCGLFQHFDGCMFGDGLENSKPAPDIYLMACERLNVLPQEAYAVEDSYFGIQSAHAAGMRAVMVPDLLPPTSEMEALSFAILKDLHEVQVFLEKQS